MAIDNTPTIDEFRPTVLRVLADGATVPVRRLCEMVADHMGLDDEVRSERIASGQVRYMNRINWACSGLTVAGLLDRPRRGHYTITDDGRAVDTRSLTAYSEKDMLEWPAWRAYQDEISARKRASSDESGESNEGESATTGDDHQSPIEAMERVEQEFNVATETELRRRLQESSPDFFERAVLDLLWAMGYGRNQGQKRQVGRSHDGGIDGIISQDALGLTNVYIQAKRYADTNRVGSPEMRNFIGSLDTHGASLGVFITTSTFLPKAIDTARGYRHGRIVLIDGNALTRYMLAHGVAVQKKQVFTLYEIDEDFFDENLE